MKREKKEKWKWKEKRKSEERLKNKETGEKRKHKLIHTDKQTVGQTDGQIDR